ncbi:anti-sigma factor [Streptomyces endophyticus]|uniref:Regulator of SigK n=1 Tax=Streptomyces endophyticus TaxID=714166 RepID=A0ABU6EYS8_9ACTN|nr:anti-sigma factor [Streptomyces endophyticus]MEB8336869.1 anti-sigma factor [Streptomyces endophyticus]
MTAADLHTLTGAYVLHALSDEERADFERHLADCEACAQESAELTATAARLGLAATVTPRPELREPVLRRITTVRQDAPREPVQSRAVRTAANRRRTLSRWALAACFAAAAALGGTAVWQHQRAQDAQELARQAEQSNDRIAAVLAAPDAKTGSAKLGGGAGGTVVVSKSEDRAVFIASGMAHPPQGKVYQLWFDDAGTMRSAGLMDTARSDQAVLLSGAVDGASGMGITVEPAGGSDQPTTDPVALMRFPA